MAARVAGFVLAGGSSRRFGQDKALVKIGDQVLLSRLCFVLREVARSVMIVGAPDKYGRVGMQCLPDRWPVDGPLGGIVTALGVSGTGEEPAAVPPLPGRKNASGVGRPEWNLIIGC